MAKKVAVVNKPTPDNTKQLIDAIVAVKRLQEFIREHGSLEKSLVRGRAGSRADATDRRIRYAEASPGNGGRRNRPAARVATKRTQPGEARA